MSDLYHIPLFIKAPTADELVREMLANNARTHTLNKYFDIQFIKGSWYAWYISDGSDLVKKVIADGIKENS